MRLIDADAMTKYIEETTADNEWLVSQYSAYWIDGFIESRHTVDAVEVVRCGECKYWQDNNSGYPHPECRWGHDETPDADDFCSCGERRDTDDKERI